MQCWKNYLKINTKGIQETNLKVLKVEVSLVANTKKKKENILPSYSVHLDMLNKNIDSMYIAQYPINCKTKIREQIHIQGLQKSHCHQLSILMTCSS